MGDLYYFLGVEVTYLADGTLQLCLCKYILDLLNRCHMAYAKIVHTLMVSSSFFSKIMGTSIEDLSEYRSFASALQYVVLTRSDIAYAINHIFQFIHALTDVHFVALKRILQYLCSTVDYGLFIKPFERLSLVGYVNANSGVRF